LPDWPRLLAGTWQPYVKVCKRKIKLLTPIKIKSSIKLAVKYMTFGCLLVDPLIGTVFETVRIRIKIKI
jgi:hypothetical protein